MSAIDEILSRPIDRTSPDVAPLLADLQGNILVGHGRDHSVHVFLRLKPENAAKDAAKAWIRNFAERDITSAQKQLEERDDFRRFRISGDLFANFFLSRFGYEQLGIPLPSRVDQKFYNGMKRSWEALQDPPLSEWEKGYSRVGIHAAILLAHDYEVELDQAARRILSEVKTFADLVAGERGRVMRNEADDVVEHFGYADGRSQPLFLQEDIEAELQKEPGVPLLYDPSAPPFLVLVPDSNGEVKLSCGSYFVFRKLEQNVRGFIGAQKELAEHLGLAEELVAAMIIGRFPDGTPVVLQEKGGQIDPIPNNFNYATDPDGFRCPFHSHIRKMNPRGDTFRVGKEPSEDERNRRIARRGITYGERYKQPKDKPALEELPKGGVGLLFMCFQSSIENQFEHLQGRWANDQDFLMPETGIDPVVGQKRGMPPYPQKWFTAWGKMDKKPFSFRGFVKLKGGEYFFAPSISALKKI